MSTERAVPAAGLSRWWRAGRAATGLLAATVEGRLGGEERALAEVMKLVERLGELKGVGMKMGQILGYIDPTMAPEMRDLLSLLHTASPASPWKAVEATVREALGDRSEALLAGLSREPIAVASVGQVHRGRVEGREVAVKVRHPGIEQAFRSDLAAATVAPSVAQLFAPGAAMAVEEAVAEVRTALLEECDFSLEARRQSMFASWFSGHPVLLVPQVEETWSASSVLTTRWRPGLSLDALLAGGASQAMRDQIGAALFELYVGMLYRRGVFHADPHPGNYAFREDGRVVVYDFGCVRSFDGTTLRGLATLVRAVREDDEDALIAALTALGASPPQEREHLALVRQLFRGFFAPLLRPGVRSIEPGTGFEAKGVLRDKRALMKLALPGKLLFLFRIRFGLYAVLARLGSRADWASLESRWALEALSERSLDSAHP